MKRRLVLSSTVFSSFALLSLTACSGGAQADGEYTGKSICVDQNTTATVISDLLEGFESQLEEEKSAGLKIVIENPNGDTAAEQTIAHKFINSGCGVVVPVGTAASQLMSTAIKDIPIVFAASSTPIEARLVDEMEAPGSNVTGVADIIDPVPDIDAMLKLKPNMKTVGLVWKLGDPAGEAQTKKAKAHLDKLGIKYIPASITNGSEITQAATSLVDRVDAIQIPGDNSTMSAIGGLIKVADDSGIPVFGGTSAVVEAGGVLSSTYDYKEVGGEVAELALKVLNGADPANTPVVVPPASGIDLNMSKLKKLDIDVPEELKDSAVATN